MFQLSDTLVQKTYIEHAQRSKMDKIQISRGSKFSGETEL